MHTWGGSHVAGLFFPEISILLFWIVITAGIVFLAVYLRGKAETTAIRQKEPMAEEILKERFARGEIEKEEFEEKIQILRM